MKTLKKQNKLSLKKFQIAKIKNLHEITGGNQAAGHGQDTVDTKSPKDDNIVG